MVSESCVIASDIGSGSCKSLLLGGSGRVYASSRREYSTLYPRPGWVEQHPEHWYEAFCGTVRDLVCKSGVNARLVAGVGIVGVTHNVVLLDARDKPLCPTILFFDNRSSLQVRAIKDNWGDRIRKHTLNDVNLLWSWPQLLWIRENRPEIWAKTRKLLFPKDYIRHRLAPCYVTDFIDASGSLLFDPKAEKWIDEFCRDLELEDSWLPSIVKPTEIVSAVSSRGASDTGLAEGTPVVAGTTDTVAEVLGSGALRPGISVIKLASVGRIAVVNTDPVSGPNILNYRHVLDGLWYPGTASKYAASAFRWLRDLFWPSAANGRSYGFMDKEAAEAAAGCGGLIFHPHLMGQWAPHWDERMRGSFIGLTISHTRSDFIRSVLEGTSFSIRDALEEVERRDLKVSDIRLIGGGSRSQLWPEILSGVLGRSLSIPWELDAAYGAALLTAIGVGLLDGSPDSLEAIIRMRRKIDPHPEDVLLYGRLFDLYRESDERLKPISVGLHELEAPC